MAKPTTRLRKPFVITADRAEIARVTSEFRLMTGTNLNTWFTQVHLGAGQAIEAHPKFNFDATWPALVGNIIWAANALTAWTPIGSALLAASGIFVSTLASVQATKITNEKQKLKADIQQRLAKTQSEAQKRISATADIAFDKAADLDLLGPADSNKRRELLWKMMFNVPFGAHNLQMAARKAASEHLKVFDKLYGQWDSDMHEYANPGNWGPGPRTRIKVGYKSFPEWVVQQPAYKNLKPSAVKQAISQHHINKLK
jgi:hypothetical protein